MPYKKKTCLDCAVTCDGRSKRCHACANKLKGQDRKSKGLRKQKFCTCGAELSKTKYNRCHACTMIHRWSDDEYRQKTTVAIQTNFNTRWANPETQKRVKEWLLKTKGISKLEQEVQEAGKEFGFEPAVVIERYVADLVHSEFKVIIEVNGDFWHCNPKFWEPEKIHPVKELTAKQIWEHDSNRKQFLESLGYTVYVIWENELKHNNAKNLLRTYYERHKKCD